MDRSHRREPCARTQTNGAIVSQAHFGLPSASPHCNCKFLSAMADHYDPVEARQSRARAPGAGQGTRPTKLAIGEQPTESWRGHRKTAHSVHGRADALVRGRPRCAHGGSGDQRRARLGGGPCGPTMAPIFTRPRRSTTCVRSTGYHPVAALPKRFFRATPAWRRRATGKGLYAVRREERNLTQLDFVPFHRRSIRASGGDELLGRCVGHTRGDLLSRAPRG